MSQADVKAEWELRVFAAFAIQSGLNINAASIESCKPPTPDIRCTINDSIYFFELAEVVPRDLAKALGTKGVYSTVFPDPDGSGERAMIGIIKQKQEKTYDAEGAPIDLLLYFNRDFPTYLSDVKKEEDTPTDIGAAAEQCKQQGPFARIWTYCTWSNDVKQLA